VTVEDNDHLKLAWHMTKEKDFARYFLYKGSRNQELKEFSLVYETTSQSDTTFTDPAIDVNTQSACYFLVMKDTCDNYSPLGKKACSIVLRGHSDPFEHTLDWHAYSYWSAGTEGYRIYRRDTERENAMVRSTSGSDSSWRDGELNKGSGLYWYYVTAHENQGGDVESDGAESRSNEISLVQAPLLHVPNAFTDNGDGLNDVWGIRDVFVKDYHLRVYNRWGQLVFETKDKYRQWEGNTDDGILQQSNVYVYTVTYTGWDGSAHTRKGNVTLLR
jgi:gliding motility-associated-like protein